MKFDDSVLEMINCSTQSVLNLYYILGFASNMLILFPYSKPKFNLIPIKATSASCNFNNFLLTAFINTTESHHTIHHKKDETIQQKLNFK